MSTRPSVVFFGTPDFSLPYLRVLAELADVRAVVCQPDKPVGRGRKLTPPPTKRLAEELSIPVVQPKSIRDELFQGWLRDQKPVLSFVVAYGKILPRAVLDLPTYGSINAHASLLPRWRGASPIAQAILAGDKQTGVCLMQMDEGMDTGAVLARTALTIDPEDTTGSLSARLAHQGAELLETSFEKMIKGGLVGEPQGDVGVSMAPLLRKEDGRICLEEDAETCARRVRAMAPWPGAFLEIHGMRIKVHRAKAFANDGEYKPGQIVPSAKGELRIACAQGALKLEEVQLAGGKAMSTQAFLAGQGRKLFMRE